MKKSTIIFNAIFLMSIALTSCTKDKVSTVSNQEPAVEQNFCSYVSNQQYAKTLVLMNDFLDSQDTTIAQDDRIDELLTWVDNESCVAFTKRGGVSYSYPRELIVDIRFNVDGQEISKEFVLYLYKTKIRAATYL